MAGRDRISGGFYCKYCKEIGHRIPECPKLMRKEKTAAASQRKPVYIGTTNIVNHFYTAAPQTYAFNTYSRSNYSGGANGGNSRVQDSERMNRFYCKKAGHANVEFPKYLISQEKAASYQSSSKPNFTRRHQTAKLSQDLSNEKLGKNGQNNGKHENSFKYGKHEHKKYESNQQNAKAMISFNGKKIDQKTNGKQTNVCIS